MTITVSRTVSMGHRLMSYVGLCSSPHGHNMRVEVEVLAATKEFLDFKVVDKVLGEVLEPFDHAMTLQDDDPLVGMLKSLKFRVNTFPVEPTTEAIAAHVLQRMTARGFERWLVRSVKVFETEKYSATVYAHT